MKIRSRSDNAFSLVEVALAIAVVAIALISVIALLPVGMTANRISSNETRATYILSTIEADLRNSASSTDKSNIYGLPTPYQFATGTLTPNPKLPAVNTIELDASNTSSVALDNSESKVALSAAQQPFQATVIYTRNWASGSNTPLEARLVVNWPSTYNVDPAQLKKQITSLSNVSGYVEAYVTFSAP